MYKNFKIRTKLLLISIIFSILLIFTLIASLVSFKFVSNAHSAKSLISEIEVCTSDIFLIEKEYIDENLSEYYLSQYTMTINKLIVKLKELESLFPEQEVEIEFLVLVTDDYMKNFFSITDSLLKYDSKSENYAAILNISKTAITEKHKDYYQILSGFTGKLRNLIANKIDWVRNLMLILFLFEVIIVILITIFITRMANKELTLPLVTLAKNMQKFAKKPTSEVIENVVRKDEIGTIINMFGSMASSIIEYSSHLKDLVKTRTNELNEKSKELEKVNANILTELKIAADIQKELLKPHYKSLDFLDLSYWDMPYREVSGDFLDIVSGDNKFTILLSDVMGHGIPAALMTMFIKSFFCAYYTFSTNLENFVFDLNNLIAPIAERIEIFTTLCLLNVEKMKNNLYKFTILNCAHPSVIFYSSQKNTVIIKKNDNLLIGVKSDTKFQEISFIDKKGSVFLLYTDGITESINADNQILGEKGILGFFVDTMKAQKETAEENLNEFRNKINEFLKGSSFNDDVSLVIGKIS